MYNEYEIRPIPLSVPHCRSLVASFLESNGLRLDEVDYYACVFKMGNDEEILAGGGLSEDIIKCIAVNDQLREEGFSTRLVSHLISEANSRGYHSVKVFTKPENQDIFESMGFQLIAQAPKAILLENGDGLRKYCQYLRGLAQDSHISTNNPQQLHAPAGVIVMNANPFTRGHRYLIEQAAQQVSHLFVIIVSEDKSEFPYNERLAMVRKGTTDLQHVTICEGSSYAISSATFPTYFLKEITDATDTHIQLDLNLFLRSIAPSLQVKVRFVGAEPTDSLTKRYNQIIKEKLPRNGCEVIEIERLYNATLPISASSVRRLIHEGNLPAAIALVVPTTIPHLLADMACRALQQELDTTPKPGLVDRRDNGSHTDMNYKLMSDSIHALRPYFVMLAEATEDTSVKDIQAIGIAAEEAMLAVTHHVNTHKGALFSLGLTVAAAALLLKEKGQITTTDLQNTIRKLAAEIPPATGTHGAEVKEKHHISGALDQARDGYGQLFREWLPFYRLHEGEEYQCHRTLLYIMSQLDDTNVVYRKGRDTAQLVKEEARQLAERFTLKGLRMLNEAFISDHISPGGSADMLALTIFIDKITLYNKTL